VAVKFFSNMPDITRSTIALFARETAITASLKHPNIIRFYGLCVMPPTISLVFELAEYGDLRRVLRNRHLLPHWDAKLMIKFCMDCARAVAYLHSRGIIHRDLKVVYVCVCICVCMCICVVKK
jgi:serine/threonine protein kinase